MTPPLPYRATDPTRSRTLRKILLAVGVSVLALAAIAALLIILFIRAINERERSFSKIRLGMTAEQIVDIMGEPKLRQHEADGSTGYIWSIREDTDGVAAWVKDGKVVRTHNGFDGTNQPP